MENIGCNSDLLTKRSFYARSCSTIGDAWEKLLVDGWTIVTDSNPMLGFDPTFREYVNTTYFGDGGVLEVEQYDVFPLDRKRAYGAVAIRFSSGGEPILEDLPPTPVVNKDRGRDMGERFYKQTKFMGDDRFRHWMTALNGLVPPPVEYIPGIALDGSGGFDPNMFFSVHGRLPSRSAESSVNIPFYAALTGELDSNIDSRLLRELSGGGVFTTKVHLLEILRDVVSGPHQDNTRWSAITVMYKHGQGATSQLFDLYSGEPFLEYTLEPGQTLILNDRRFRHSATPLEPAADGLACRRAIVCEFDFIPNG